MVQSSSSTPIERSRLESLLTGLSSAKFRTAEHNLAERLSYLIGVSGSIDLARSLKQLPTKVKSSVTGSELSLEDDLVNTCQQMMLVITSSFVAKEGAEYHETQLKVPSANGLRLDALQNYDPYRRFYVAHQTEMALGLQALRRRIRASLSCMSVELHQLAELDEILDENLVVHTRRLFNVIPKLLEERFDFLLKRHRQLLEELRELIEPHSKKTNENSGDELEHWLLPDGWLALFYQDTREMLLAEFDVRLQPILGLIEALNEQKEIS